jgi:hypothetical protein
LWSSDVICPECYSELEPRRWATLLTIAAAIFVPISIRTPLRDIGLGVFPAIALAMAVSAATAIGVYALVMRFRPKSKPPSLR